MYSERFCLLDNYLTRSGAVSAQEFGCEVNDRQKIYVSDYSKMSISKTASYLIYEPEQVAYTDTDMNKWFKDNEIVVKFIRDDKCLILPVLDTTFNTFDDEQVDDINKIIEMFYYDVKFKKADVVHYKPVECNYRNCGIFAYDGSKFITLELEHNDYGYMPLELMSYFKPTSETVYNKLKERAKLDKNMIEAKNELENIIEVKNDIDRYIAMEIDLPEKITGYNFIEAMIEKN